MRNGVRIALDLGAARVGVARSDALGQLALPHEVWPFTDVADLVARVGKIVQEHSPLEVLIGLPIDLRGEQGIAADAVLGVAQELAKALPEVSFRLVDERLTTAAARKLLQSAGYSAKLDRSVIDAAAATVLLEDALEAERRQGKPAGQVVQ